MSESTTPTPEPMTDEQRAEIREAARPGYADILAQLIKHGAHDDPKHGRVIVHGVTVVPAADLKAAVRVVWFGAPALLVEVERLRAELDNLQDADSEATVWHDEFQRAKAERDEAREQLAAFVPPGTLGAGETPALCGTCKELLCVPGLPGCAHCVAAEVERLRAEQDIDRQALDRAAADHAQLRVEVTDERRHHADYVRQIETERDAAREQVKRVRDYAGHIAQSDNTAYAKAGRDLLQIVGPVAALDGTEATS